MLGTVYIDFDRDATAVLAGRLAGNARKSA
jgi:hypothetical protein